MLTLLRTRLPEAARAVAPLVGVVCLLLVTTWGEPAVRILAGQVEDASTGSIRRSVLWSICLGVAVAFGASAAVGS